MLGFHYELASDNYKVNPIFSFDTTRLFTFFDRLAADHQT